MLFDRPVIFSIMLLLQESLVPHKVAQKNPQLAHVVSCGWWRDVPPSFLHPPQLITWANCIFFCATLCGTKRTLLLLYFNDFTFFLHLKF